MGSDTKFMGWMGLDKKSIGNMKWQEFEPKPWEETDVEIKISHSGYVAAKYTLGHHLLTIITASVHRIFILSDLVGVPPTTQSLSDTRSSERL